VRPLPDGRALRPTDRWPARRVRHSTPPHNHRLLIEPCQCRALRAHASWRRRPAERENAFVRAHGQKHVRGQKVPMNDRSLYTARTRARKCRLSGETARQRSSLVTYGPNPTAPTFEISPDRIILDHRSMFAFRRRISSLLPSPPKAY
jgi:hypothetical protein